MRGPAGVAPMIASRNSHGGRSELPRELVPGRSAACRRWVGRRHGRHTPASACGYPGQRLRLSWSAAAGAVRNVLHLVQESGRQVAVAPPFQIDHLVGTLAGIAMDEQA